MSAQLSHNKTFKKISFSETVCIIQAPKQISLSQNQILIWYAHISFLLMLTHTSSNP